MNGPGLFVCPGRKGDRSTTVKDITSACQVEETTPGKIKMVIPLRRERTRGREACVLFSIAWQWPDPFSPKLPEHHRELITKYANVGTGRRVSG